MSDKQFIEKRRSERDAAENEIYLSRLRDQLAMAALTGLLAHSGSSDVNRAIQAYAFADDALEARND